VIRRAAKVDDNHNDIVDALREAHCLVVSLAAVGKGVPDLLVCSPYFSIHESLLLLEVKDGSKPPSARRLTKDEEAFRAAGWPVVVVTSVEEALKAVGADP
jgi:hypothetical protein